MITICFDFGNTRQKFAVFNNHQLINVEVIANVNEAGIGQIIEQYNPTKTILSSVILHQKEIETVLQQHSKFHLLNHLSKLPVTTPVGKPETIGADRLAICAAASFIYPKKHCLAIGLGSCITYNFINKFSEFLGGSISPGMNMRFKAMNEHTALLPIVPAEHQFPLIGYDTKTNLQSGVLLGIAKEIDGIIDLYKDKFEDLQVLMTGGDAEFFKHHLTNEIYYDEQLLFKGLLAISEVNNN